MTVERECLGELSLRPGIVSGRGKSWIVREAAKTRQREEVRPEKRRRGVNRCGPASPRALPKAALPRRRTLRRRRAPAATERGASPRPAPEPLVPRPRPRRAFGGGPTAATARPPKPPQPPGSSARTPPGPAARRPGSARPPWGSRGLRRGLRRRRLGSGWPAAPGARPRAGGGEGWSCSSAASTAAASSGPGQQG